jgi:hypothetical protein
LETVVYTTIQELRKTVSVVRTKSVIRPFRGRPGGRFRLVLSAAGIGLAGLVSAVVLVAGGEPAGAAPEQGAVPAVQPAQTSSTDGLNPGGTGASPSPNSGGISAPPTG